MLTGTLTPFIYGMMKNREERRGKISHSRRLAVVFPPLGAAAVLLCLLARFPLPAWPAAAGDTAKGTPAAPPLPPSFYLVDGDRFPPLYEKKVNVVVRDNVKYFYAPLDQVPEAESPLKVLDTYPADGPSFYILRLYEDGLIFSWDIEDKYIKDKVKFHPFFDSIDERKIMTWNEIKPGLYAFVDHTSGGMLGDICFVFRIVP